MRKVAKHCVSQEDEWMFQTCNRRDNRLQPLAVHNKHASIKGIPQLTPKMVEEAAKVIILLKGVYQKKHKAAHENGQLRLHRKPMAYK